MLLNRLGICSLLSALAIWPSAARQLCLPASEAVPAEDRVTVLVNGSKVPFGIVQFNWAISLVDSEILAILVEEVLGVRTAFLPALSTPDGLFQLAGCSCHDCEVPRCYSEPLHSHVMIGSWINSVPGTEQRLKLHYPEMDLPEWLGEMGHKGSEGTYVLEKTRAKAFSAVEQNIEYYRAYSSSFDLSQFFSRREDIPAQRLTNCSAEGAFTQKLPRCQTFLAATGDLGGVELQGNNGDCHIRCHGSGQWWFSPACRQEPEKCIPWITGGNGWGSFQMMQQAVWHNMPIAVAVASSYSDYLTLPLDFEVQLYWWYPDPSFVELQPMEIILPAHNKLEWDAGIYRTRSEQQTIGKYGSRHLSDTKGLQAKELTRRLSFTLEQVTQLLLYMKNETGQGSADRVACRWVRENSEIWRGWIPQNTQCSLGQGLSDAGAFVASRAQASTCTFCSLGRYSAPFQDELGLSHVCLPCPAGSEQKNAGQGSCSACRPGYFKEEASADLCKECAPGSATGLEGQSSCSACAPGRVAPEAAQLSCHACAPGTAASGPGGLACSFCEPGSFAEEAGSPMCTNCSSVIAGSTSVRGAARSEECACPKKSFMRPGQGCTPCPVGLECRGGNAEPLQSAGFWVDVTQPLLRQARNYTIYRCRDLQECPEGVLGNCAAGRKDTACNNCQDHHYSSSAGRCLPCEAGSVLPVVFCLLCFISVLVLMVACMRMESRPHHLTMLTMALITGQTFTTIQTLGAVKAIQVRWPEALIKMLDFFSIFVFDLDWLRLPCLISSDNPVTKFALTLLTYPTFLLLLLAIWKVSWFLGRPVDKIVPLNINGALLLMIYISMTLTVMLPFQCHMNPSGFLSMATNPGLRCFDDPNHMALATLAFIGILIYPVGVAAWILHATLRYKATARRLAGVQLLRRFKFLFGRFKPERYYFGMLALLFSGCVATIPIFFVQVPVLQVMAMALVLLSAALCQAWFRPWRTWLANVTDAFLGGFRTIAITGVAVLMEGAQEEMTTFIGVALVLTFMSIAALLLVLLCTTLYRHHVHAKPYGIFLCHHKATAGAFCRLVKMILESSTSSSVFLDSDDLEDLEHLFDTVRSDVANLVVVLNQQVLTRPWCVGEIVTAYRNSVPIVPLTCDDFDSDATAELLRSFSESWSDEDVNLLLRYEINMTMATQACQHLLSLPMERISRMQPLAAKEVAMAGLVTRCKLPLLGAVPSMLPSLGTMPSMLPSVPSIPKNNPKQLAWSGSICWTSVSERNHWAPVVILGLASDPEKLAACEIMQMELQRQLEVPVEVLCKETQAFEMLQNTSLVLVLWSSGLLEDPTFARILLQVGDLDQPPEFLTALADSSFQFPTAASLRRLEEESCLGLDLEQRQQLAAQLRRLLSTLSRPFEALRSRSSIEEQVRELAGRARPLLGDRNMTPLSGPTTPGSGPEPAVGTSQWSRQQAQEDSEHRDSIVCLDRI